MLLFIPISDGEIETMHVLRVFPTFDVAVARVFLH
jgi:hypothetical protein